MTEPNSFARIFTPCGANLLVRPDALSDRVGTLYRPDNARQEKPQTGVVVRVGPLCDPHFTVGLRVVFGPFDGQDLRCEGETLKLVPQLAILAYLDGSESGDPLDESWKDHLEPPPGQLLVERAAQPVRRGLIYVPDGIRLTSRASEAIVVRSDTNLTVSQPRLLSRWENVRLHLEGFVRWLGLTYPFSRVQRTEIVPYPYAFAEGERIFLGGTVSRRIPLGAREDVELYVVRPSEVSGRLADEPPEPVEVEDNPHLAALPELRREVRDTRAFEEGDTRAPR